MVRRPSTYAAISAVLDAEDLHRPAEKACLRAARVIEQVTVYAATVLLILAVLAFGATEPWSIWAFEIGAMVLLLLWASAQVLAGTIEYRRNPLHLPALAFLIVLAAQLLFRTSAYHYVTYTETLQYLAYAALFFVVSQTPGDEATVGRWLKVVVVFGFALALFALIQGFTTHNSIYWLVEPRYGGSIYGPYVNRNHYAGLMEMLIPFPFVLACLPRRSAAERVLYAFAGVLMSVTVITSQSRAGTVALAVEMVFLASFLLTRHKKAGTALGIAAVALALAAFVVWLGGGQLFARFGQINDVYRTAILKDAPGMFGRHPLIGWGLGTFPVVYPHFRSFYTDLFVNQAHNDILQLLLETGLLGFSAGVWFIVALYRKVFSKLGFWRGSYGDAVTLAGIAGCTALLFHSFFDFNLHIAANAAWFYAICALAGSHQQLRSQRENGGRCEHS